MHYPTKSLREVYGTPLNNVWKSVGPQIRDLVRNGQASYSINAARFMTHEEDKEETLGPVVIWIGVHPGSTSPDTAHEVSQKILELLEKSEVEDVEVEWHESVITRLAGPALLGAIDSEDPTRDFYRHLTATLGMPIANQDDAEGSVGFFFHEGRDKRGEPSSKVFGVTNHHLLCREDEEIYEHKGGAPRRCIQVNGTRRFEKGLDEVLKSIANYGMAINLRMAELVALQKQQVIASGKEKERVDASLRKVQRLIEDDDESLTRLRESLSYMKTQWGEPKLRNIGHTQYSPPLTVNSVEGQKFTEDWGVFELNEDKFKAHFEGNLVDLGASKLPSLFMFALPNHINFPSQIILYRGNYVIIQIPWRQCACFSLHCAADTNQWHCPTNGPRRP